MVSNIGHGPPQQVEAVRLMEPMEAAQGPGQGAADEADALRSRLALLPVLRRAEAAGDARASSRRVLEAPLSKWVAAPDGSGAAKAAQEAAAERPLSSWEFLRHFGHFGVQKVAFPPGCVPYRRVGNSKESGSGSLRPVGG